jgi:uncharacterized surface protein with fasciclin (FAS1) repeats
MINERGHSDFNHIKTFLSEIGLRYHLVTQKTTYMKRNFLFTGIASALLLLSVSSCDQQKPAEEASAATAQTTPDGGQSTVKDDQSAKDVVKIAVGSKDHKTLVAALKAAEYVDVLSNSGPFTVFAPTNAAFDKLPKGTVEGLVKPEAKKDLRNILEYHVFVGVLKQENLHDGQTINQVNGDNATIGLKDGKFTINGANVLAAIPASNGIIYVIDNVLLPPAKK